MDLFNRSNLRRLAELQDEVCISLYMPTYRDESNWSQNTTRLKNLLGEARDQLRDQDYREDDIDQILGDARQLLDRPSFWRSNIGDGLAVFITSESTELFRLPLSFEEVAIVGDRFHLKPLFPIIAANNRFYLIALSQSEVRFFQGTHQAMTEIETTTIPSDIVEAIQQSESPEEQPQPQRQGSGREGLREDGAPVQENEETVSGGLNTDPLDELKHFLRQVDESVNGYIGGEDVPLLLAGNSEYLPLYREVNSYSHLTDDEIVVDSSNAGTTEELHEKAWSVVEPVFQAAEKKEAERFDQLYYQDEKMASDDFHEVLPGCAYSRVQTLFVPVGEYRWGRFDPSTNTVEVHENKQPGDGDLLNYAAVNAYLNGATVHVLRPEKMPGGRSIAATFRYQADVSAQENG